MLTLPALSEVLGTALILAACAYVFLAAIALHKSRAPRLAMPASSGRPVTVLKPLCGAEPRLYDNLRGFCRQHYAEYQLVFGVRESTDPAIDVVRRLQREFPERDIQLVVAPQVYGHNLKVSNLINMLAAAKHDWLVLADSDIDVPDNYLSHVVAPLADPGTGIVTCLYRGRPGGGIWSQLGTQFIDEWFAPSVRLSQMFGSQRFGFGATIALRRDCLEGLGGLATLKDTLADDYWLGELSRRQGLRSVLSSVVTTTDVTETSLASLWAHELRWLRTIRALAPAGFAMSFVCFTLPILGIGLILAHNSYNFVMACAGMMARWWIHFTQRRGRDWQGAVYEAWLVPVRDLLLFIEWTVALTRWQVSWRGQVMNAKGHDPA
ncbi:bacteriohopanetetrol glucosamine biosynthesis glycosyltransferase HpnI [Frateuria aurantia]